jgi:hypothetical protein
LALAAQSTSSGYDPAFVGAVVEPLYLKLLAVPPPKHEATVLFGVPSYVAVDGVADAVGVAGLTIKLPADALVVAL